MKKVALITGASRGIGQAIANSLYNYNLILCSKSMKFQDRYSNILSMPCDITNKNQVKEVVNKGLEKFGRIDVLINNAGCWKFNNFGNITEEELQKMYDVNVKGILLCSQGVLETMLKQNSGHIINILSIRSITGAPDKAAYSASKFAAKGLMDSLRMEIGPAIKITNICPGKISNEDVTTKDICKTVDYILSLSDKATVRDIVIGGQL
jgi:NADP-dependent 3-hydroxy acid dehydrogenase YdfG